MRWIAISVARSYGRDDWKTWCHELSISQFNELAAAWLVMMERNPRLL